MLPSVYDTLTTETLLARINELKPTTTAKWGKMNVAQMLAHCNVSYELTYEPEKHKKPNFIMAFISKKFIKKLVTNEVSYKPSSPTASAFIIKTNKDFDTEKQRLIDYISKTEKLGKQNFEGLESHSFGVLNATEWSNMFYKHLDHHFNQFGV